MRHFTIGFAAGLALFLWSSAKVALGAGVGLWLALFIASRTSTQTPTKRRAFARSVLLGMLVGVLVAHIVIDLQLDKQFPKDTAQRDYRVVGTVASVPKRDERRISFIFEIERYVTEQQARAERVRLNWYGPMREQLHAGDRWEFVVRLKTPSSLGNPGGFHYARWLFQSRLQATGYVRDSPTPKRINKHAFDLHGTRQQLAESVGDLPSANQNAALVQGLAVGVTNNISREQWQTLRNSGTAHLLAISGLHIGLIAGWMYVVARVLWSIGFYLLPQALIRRTVRPVFALIASFCAACTYAALAGFSLPTQRALLMLGVFALSIILRRVWPPGTALLLALFFVLLLDPLMVLSVGFWLSFGTVGALFYLNQGRINQAGKVRDALSVHIKLGFVLLPATAWFFQQGAMIAPMANVVAVPYIGLLVVPLSLLVALLAPLWPRAANSLLELVQWMLAQLLSLLDWLLLLPGASVPLFLPSAFVLLFSLIGLALVFSPRALHLRWLCVPLIAPALLFNLVGKPVRYLELHALDVGQGLASVVFTKNHTVLFDTGIGSDGTSTMIDRVVQPFLIANGRSTIDFAILSHADEDHAGGIDALVELYPEAQLISSDLEHHKHYQAQACVAGQSFTLDDVTFSFLHPGRQDLGTRNNLSCVLLVHGGDTRLLLTGDIESESERLLISRVNEPLPVSAMIAPHHGSSSSSTASFVSMFRPDNVIFAAGENNRYGFPHEEVVKRYKNAGANGFITGSGGAVSMRFDESGLLEPAVQYWDTRRRYRR